MSSASVLSRAEAPVAPSVAARPGREWVLFAPALIALAVRLYTGAQPIDDAYITFRYAQNLGEGLGLVYNPGEWVLGTTAPLWALALSLGYRLGATDLPWLALAISAVCDAASAVLLARLARGMGWSAPAAALVGLAWALNPMSIAFAAGGMETSAFVLGVLVSLSLALRPSTRILAAGLAGAMTLLRPEGALIAVAIVGWDAYSRRRLTWRPLFAAGLPMATLGLVLFAVYGSPLPHSVAAKQVAYAPVGPFENIAVLLVHAGLPGFSTFLLAVLPLPVWFGLALFGLSSLIYFVRAGAARVPSPFLIFGVMFLSFYVVVGLRGVRLFSWYTVPIEPVYLLIAAAGLRRFGRTSLLLLVVLWQASAIDWHQPFMPTGSELVREHLFADAGRELAATLPPSATVAAPEIGAVGYTSGLRVLDTVGLISPEAVPYYPLPADQLVTDNAIPTALINDQRPEAVVTLDAYVQHTLLEDPTFLQSYTLVDRRPAEVWQSHELLVFRRNAP